MRKLEPKCPRRFNIRGYRHKCASYGGYFQSETEIYSSVVVFKCSGSSFDGDSCGVRSNLNPDMIYEYVFMQLSSHVNVSYIVHHLLEVAQGIGIDRNLFLRIFYQLKERNTSRNHD